MNLRTTLFKLLLPGLAGLLVASCMSQGYSTAHSLFVRGRYAAAIERFDHFIATTENGAKATQAQLERSEAYYHLGLRANERERWKLAVRFFYLSNLPKADAELDDCYFTLAQIALEETDYEQAFYYFRLVTDNLPESELVPRILFERIRLHMDEFNNDAMAWGDYVELYDNHPDSPYMLQAQPYADRFLTDFIDQVVNMQYAVGYMAVIEQLKLLAEYPSSYRGDIFVHIGDLYLKLAEQQVTREEYIEAERSFRAAESYDPTRAEHVSLRLNEIVSLFIDRGDVLLAERDIDSAIELYEETFDIIPGYEPAISAIVQARLMRENINKADSLFQLADRAVENKEFEDALRLYRQANVYDQLPRYRDKIFLVTNLINIEQDPVGFAKSVVSQYRNGRIIQRINALENRLVAEYGRENIISSPELQFMLSVGEAKYEVRYDISTPDESYYLTWLVNLRDRSITPLNIKSEELIQ
ncbi:MAG: tetratricopeptide repeat protein [Candidatus Cloacimonetes bacterium]|nr:tetratricopeptide repeat protein [Candidatus Cloacimonadota bacterium]